MKKNNNGNKYTYLYNRKLNKNPILNMWFAFPGPESFALSSLGYLWLYKKIDMMEEVNIEMIFSETKTTAIMKEKIDLIAFTFSFDMDFLEIFKILEKNNFDFYAKNRNEHDPIIFAGGPVITSNPEPYSEFFDFLIIGDGEDVNIQAIKLCMANKNKTKKQKLEMLSKLEGVYVPSVNQDKVVKLTKKLSECIYTPIISDNAFFKNTFILEVERGCANRCGFCLASYMNLPLRFVSYEQIIETIDLGLAYTNKIALLGAQITAHPRFYDICKYIDNKIKSGENIQMSISSLRVDAFVPEIVQTLVNAGQNNLTLAIEAASERLRKVINKNITEEQILNAVNTAKLCGLKGIKFYAMLGLPTETQEDIEEFVLLSKRIKQKFKSFKISFGFSTFVPKPNTPFQWVGRENDKSLENKIMFLKKELHKLGIEISVSSPKWDYYQAVLSRGDRKLAPYLVEVYKSGAKLGAFKKAARQLNINTDYYALQNYSTDDELSWNFIETKPSKDFLKQEYDRLLNFSR